MQLFGGVRGHENRRMPYRRAPLTAPHSPTDARTGEFPRCPAMTGFFSKGTRGGAALTSPLT